MVKRLLVYLEPCIFRDDPTFLQGHLECFVNPVLRALSLDGRLAFLGFASNVFLALQGLDSARGLPVHPEEVKVYPLYNRDLLSRFGHCLEDYAHDVFDPRNPALDNPGLLERLSAVIGDAQPDLVITTSQNRYLTHLSRKHGFKLLSMEYGPLPRLVHPNVRFMAIDGHLSEGAFASPARLLERLRIVQDTGDTAPLREFESSYLDAIATHPQYGAVRGLIEKLRRQGSVSMLALQPEQWLTWEGALGKRRSGSSIIHEALATLQTDKLIVTFHLDKRGHINPITLREIWLSDPRLELLPDDLSTGISELILPFVDEVVTVSSNIAMAAFLLGKPLRSIGNSFAQTLAQLSVDSVEDQKTALRNQVLRYLHEHMSVDDATFCDATLLRARLDHCLGIGGNGAPSLTPVGEGQFAEKLASTDSEDHLPGVNLGAIHGPIATCLQNSSSAADLLPWFGRHVLGYMLEPNAIGAEFGVARGYFSESLLRSGRFARLYSIDKWDDHHNDEEHAAVVVRLAPFGVQSQIVRMSFEEALATIADGSLDFIYVDGYAHTGHDADIVRQSLCKLKPGALVAVHDYDEFSWPLNHRSLSALFSQSVFTDRHIIPPVLTRNNEDIFPGMVARFIP